MPAGSVTPLFDSLAHPTLSGDWFGRGIDARIETLVAALAVHGFRRACAVGISGVEGYTHADFARICQAYDNLIPIAGVDPSAPALREELRLVADLGYRGIKLHPRLSSFSLRDRFFTDTLVAAAECNLTIFLCTYSHTNAASYPTSDPLYDLSASLERAPDARVVLLHGGDVELMRYAQLVRHSPNLLLDVSFTMMKYRGSSLDLDLRYLFEGLNSKICIGTDHPEYGHGAVRDRFDALTIGLSEPQRLNAGHDNLARFLGIDG